ncbi:protein FAR1-RELATED SEQUENCE 4-like [Humulus lupulus]|uniref:protein FAR1-RELATED SEQUENCE 4-like n=1 Tax=Humulus lupulus TaxID=3486 RepID=UPI002B4132CA|nr:protein FAR1-RELATED SEQUENCE 4-like [Humulus lupulus]
MTNIDLSSNPQWEEILGSLQLYKLVAKIDRTNIRGKDMETLDKWEAFYKTYAKWVGFGVRIDDTKYRDGIISIRRMNKYNKPLTIIVGVKEHFETCVFGCAVIVDETEDTYCWFLRVFLEYMGNKKLKVMLTDNDERIGFAVNQILSDCTHRLYTWHLGNNATKNIKSPEFDQGFYDLIYTYYT